MVMNYNTPTRTGPEGVFNIPEAMSYRMVYALTPPAVANYGTVAVPYTTNNAASIATGSFTRIGYYLELQTGAGSLQYVYASFDAAPFSTDASKLGVPTAASGEVYHYDAAGLLPGQVRSMNIVSNVAGITTGTGITTGNVEFWPSNYTQANTYAVPGASATAYDFGDGPAAGNTGHGTMQISNYGAGQVLFAYNHWNTATSGDAALGIGNQPVSDPDWTFATNVNGYTVKNLYVVVDGGVPPTGLLSANSPLFISAGSTLDINGVSQQATSLSDYLGSGGSVTNNGAFDATLTVSDGTGSFSGVISDGLTNKTALTKSGTGTQALTGANTYTGVTNINGGILNVGSAETPGVSGPLGNQLANAAGTILFNGGTLQYSAANQFDYSGRFGTATPQAVSIDTNGQNVTFATALSSVGGSLAKTGAGTLTLTALNTYTGPTNINAGTLRISGAGQLPASTAVTLANVSGATLDLNSLNQTIGSLAGGGATGGNVTLGSATLTVSGGGNTSFAGGISGTGGLSVSGTGTTLTLAGTSSYTGATSLSGTGKLVLGPTSSLGNTAITVNSGATLAPRPTAGGTLAIGTGLAGAGASLTVNSGGIFDMVDGSIGTFQINAPTAGPSLNLNGGIFNFEVGAAADQLLVNGPAASLTGSNTINITALTGIHFTTPGSLYTLISNASGGLLESSGNIFTFAGGVTSEILTVGSSKYKLTLVNSGTAEQLAVTPAGNDSVIQALPGSISLGRMMTGQTANPLNTQIVNVSHASGANTTGFTATPNLTAVVSNLSNNTAGSIGAGSFTAGIPDVLGHNTTGSISVQNTGNDGSGTTGSADPGINGDQQPPIVIAVSGTVVAKRVVTASSVDLGLYHVGASPVLAGKTTTLSSNGSDDTTTRVTVAGNLFNNTMSVPNVPVTGTVGALPAGIVTGNLDSLPVTKAENGGAGLVGEGSYAPVAVGYTATVTTGQAVWTPTSGTSWSHPNFADTTNALVHAAPGTFGAPYDTTDSATFNGLGSGTVTLDGATPSLNALNFSGTTAYTLGVGTGNPLTDSLTLKNAGATAANVTVDGTAHHLIGRVARQEGAYLVACDSFAVSDQNLDSCIGHDLLLRVYTVQYLRGYAMSIRLARREGTSPPSGFP